jgi:hypothetical protein
LRHTLTCAVKGLWNVLPPNVAYTHLVHRMGITPSQTD